MSRLLDHIESPNDLHRLDAAQLEQLADELRACIITTTAKTGGHLAPSLGVVELTLGIYRALDCPPDIVTWDVGHQAYAHKLLTGRRDRFDTLRTAGGISGFLKREESEFDLYGSGHASDSVSMSLGYTLARRAAGKDGIVTCVIGDGSMTGGMAFEALAHLGHLREPMVVVLNDNEMSISQNIGAIATHLGRARLDRHYTRPRDSFQEVLERTKLGARIAWAGKTAKESVKKLMVLEGMLFEELGLTYVGPIDGHNIAQVEAAVRAAKESGEAVLIHAVTQKGRGFDPAVKAPTKFHGICSFDPESGAVHVDTAAPPTYTQVFSNAMVELAAANQHICAITAAMAPGTGLEAFAEAYPARFHDVGIAEEHAVGLAAGLALGGQVPVCAIYSTFLQRAYDQIIGNVALQNAHVVFAIDRGGFVGDDGPTHHGVFDLTYLRSIPTMQILAPRDEAELVSALKTAVALEGPVAVRYPRGAGEGVAVPTYADAPMWEHGTGETLRADEGASVAFVAVGRMVRRALEAAELLAAEGIACTVIDARWIKPLDEELLCEAIRTHELIVTVEENTVCGGFGAAVLELLAAHRTTTEHAKTDAAPLADVLVCGVPDEFASQGTMDELIAAAALDAHSLASRTKARLNS